MNDAAIPHTLDTIAFNEAGTLHGLFERRCARSPHTEAYRQFNPAMACWRGYTWGDAHALVGHWRAALAAENLAPGDRVAVMLRNCVEWVCYDQAAQSLGLTRTSLYRRMEKYGL